METKSNFPGISIRCGNPIETAIAFHEFPHDYHSVEPQWKPKADSIALQGKIAIMWKLRWVCTTLPHNFHRLWKHTWQSVGNYMETKGDFHLISTGCGNLVETNGIPPRLPQPVEIMRKPVEARNGFHMISTGCGNPMETNGNQQGFHMIPTSCGNHPETNGNQKRFPQDFHSLWKSQGNLWKP